MTEPLLLKCPNCQAALRTVDLDLERGLARCSYCRAVAVLPRAQEAAREEPKFRPRADVPMPPGIALEERTQGVCIRQRWFTPIVFFLIPFCIAWNGFLVFWYGVAFGVNAPWIMKVFPLGHVAVGVGLTYFVLATLLNRTEITADGGRLKVDHGPLPWRGNTELQGDDIEQLYCKARTSRTKNGERTTSCGRSCATARRAA